MKEIYFIRHGETDNNKLGKAQGGSVDSELNNTGIEQAKYTGKYLKEYRIKDINFDLVYSSPLKRAKKTAEIICENIGYDKNKIIFDDNLREKNDGLLGNNLTWNEMKTHPQFKSYVKLWENILKEKDPIELHYKSMDDNLHQFIKEKYGGSEYELHQDIVKRLKKFINQIKKSESKKILVVAHNGTILDILEIMFNIGFEGSRKIRDFKFGSNCHITLIKQEKNKFKMIMPPNTLHFGIYNKNYSK